MYVVFSLIAVCFCPVWPLIMLLQLIPSRQVLLMELWSVALVLVSNIFFLLMIIFFQYIIFNLEFTCFCWHLFKNININPHKLFFKIFTVGERFFPPPSGLSYSSWFCIEHFSSPPNNHPVRLLTVVRRANSSEQHYVCLAIVLSAKDRSLIVSTKEELLQNYGQYLFFLFSSFDYKSIKTSFLYLF